MLRRNFIALTLFLLGFPEIPAAENSEKARDFFTGFQFHRQHIWAHHKEMRPYTSRPANSLEFTLGLQTHGNKLWESLYNFPAYGVGFFYSDLGREEVLGNVKSGFLFLEFPIRRGDRFDTRMKYSLGLSYFSNFYDEFENPANQFIGTPWNVHFNLNYSWLFHLSHQWQVAPGLSFTHFSNGAYRKPNKGFNLFDVNLGVRYHLNGLPALPSERPSVESPSGLPQRKLFMVFSFGTMQRNVGDPNYSARTFSVNLTRQSGLKNRWGIGMDLFYDEHAKEQVRNENNNAHPVKYLRGGSYVSHDLIFNRMSLVMNLGVYVFYGYEPVQPIYQRVGLRYAIDRRLLTSLTLKAHYGQAEYVEWGIGYGF